MIDYGLFALIVVVLALIFLAFHAWRGIKAEGERISVQSTQVDAKVAKMALEIEAARALAQSALSLAQEVQGTHYKSLLHRINEAEATAAAAQKQNDVLGEKIASMGGRLSALARWQKKDPEAAPEEPPAGEQVPMFPAAMPPPGNVHVTGHFGRMPARKVG